MVVRGERMTERDIYAQLSALPDDGLRGLFRNTLEDPASVEAHVAPAWRDWLVSFLLKYFNDHHMQSVTDRCRYLAFALRYLVAIETTAPEPIKVRQIVYVMENRPGVVSRLLFGTVDERRCVLSSAFDLSTESEVVGLEPFQQVILDEYMLKVVERKGAGSSRAFDESTVARWSRDPIPALEKLVIEHFRPARHVAQNQALKRIVVGQRVTDEAEGDRAQLVAYVEQFETGPLSIYLDTALAALNNYDRRIENEQQSFATQKRFVIGFVLLLTMVFMLLGLPALLDLSILVRTLTRPLGLFVGGVAGASLLLTSNMVWSSAVHASEHIATTRTDIQTLQQLAEYKVKKSSPL